MIEKIEAIGFDLDGTLYPSKKEMDDRIRQEISKKILLKKPELENLEKAREHFEERYKELHSGTEILRETGYPNAGEIMDKCLANADVLDLIDEDKELQKILERLKDKFMLYLLTSSPKELSIKKLEKMGINPEIFNYMFFSDTPNIGSKGSGEAFNYVIREMGIEPSQHLYVGDRERTDVIPAKEKGMETIRIGEESSASITIKNIKDIEEVLL
jgi:FMN phosphatase YigB (HAD superfamily)